MRRPRPDHVLRPEAGRRAPSLSPPPAWLGPPQPVLLPDAAESRGVLRIRHRRRVRGSAGKDPEGAAVRLGQADDPVLVHQRARPHDDPRARVRRIIPNLERRYRETDSVAVREELSKYQNNQPCPSCDGTRRREARHVRIGTGDYARGIFEISGWRARARLFRRPVARRREARDRRQGHQGNRRAPHLPEQRRPRLPVARAQRGNPVGRRGAAHPARVADRLGPHGRDTCSTSRRSACTSATTTA